MLFTYYSLPYKSLHGDSQLFFDNITNYYAHYLNKEIAWFWFLSLIIRVAAFYHIPIGFLIF